MCAMVDYDRVLTCSREPIIKLWSLGGGTDGNPIVCLEGHEMPVTTIAYEASSGKIASAGRDCMTRVWDLEK